MSNMLNGYTPQTIKHRLERLNGGGDHFLTNTLFKHEDVLDTEYVSLAKTKMRARVLPVVGRDAPATPVNHADGTIEAIMPPILKPITSINPSVASTPFLGDPSFQGMNTNRNANLNRRILTQGQTMLDSIAVTKEYWSGQILATGRAILSDIEGNSLYDLNMGFTTGSTEDDTIQTPLTANDLWTSDLSKIEAHLRYLKRCIQRTSGYTGKLNVLLGHQVVEAVLSNKKTAEALNNLRMNVGHLTPSQQSNYLGTLHGFDLFSYDAAAFPHDSDDIVEIWDPYSIAVIPADGRAAGISMCYATILDSIDGSNRPESLQHIQTKLYSKMYMEPNPPSIQYYIATRPCPIITNPKAIRIQQVIPKPGE